MVYLREFGKVSRQLIMALTGTVDNLVVKTDYLIRDYSNCSKSCPLYSLPNDNKNKICSKGCDYNVPLMRSKQHINESHDYKIPEEWKTHSFSKSQIKQLILYHMLPIDGCGFLTDISYKQMASYLGVSKRTIKNNNKIFVNLGIISVSSDYRGYFNLLINDYEKYHLSFKEGGNGGYIKVSNDFFQDTFMCLNDRTEMRYALRYYLKGVLNNEEFTYSIDEIKCFTPSYKKYPKAIRKVADKIKNAFKTNITGKTLRIIANSKLNIETLKKEKVNQIRSLINTLCKENNKMITNEEVLNIEDLGFEFGLDNLFVILPIFFKFHIHSIKEGQSVGSRLRILLKSNAYGSLA